MIFTDSNHFSMSLSCSYSNITDYVPNNALLRSIGPMI